MKHISYKDEMSNYFVLKKSKKEPKLVISPSETPPDEKEA